MKQIFSLTKRIPLPPILFLWQIVLLILWIIGSDSHDVHLWGFQLQPELPKRVNLWKYLGYVANLLNNKGKASTMATVILDGLSHFHKSNGISMNFLGSHEKIDPGFVLFLRCSWKLVTKKFVVHMWTISWLQMYI